MASAAPSTSRVCRRVVVEAFEYVRAAVQRGDADGHVDDDGPAPRDGVEESAVRRTLRWRRRRRESAPSADGSGRSSTRMVAERSARLTDRSSALGRARATTRSSVVVGGRIGLRMRRSRRCRCGTHVDVRTCLRRAGEEREGGEGHEVAVEDPLEAFDVRVQVGAQRAVGRRSRRSRRGRPSPIRGQWRGPATVLPVSRQRHRTLRSAVQRVCGRCPPRLL